VTVRESDEPVKVRIPLDCGKPVSLEKTVSTKPEGDIEEEIFVISSKLVTRVAYDAP
jgi:hypothetical protein